MKNIKRINIVDLIFLVLLVLVVAFGAYKLSDVNSVTESNAPVKATYIVEVPEETPEILNHLKVGDKVYEDDSLKSMGVLSEITQKPYKIHTENKETNTVNYTEYPGKILVELKITADAVKSDGAMNVDGVNILVGKTIDLNVGNTYVKGVIIGVSEADEEAAK